MKLQIYSVSEKRPPIEETIILWKIDENGIIYDMKEGEANIAIPESQEELEMIEPGIVTDAVWVDENGSTEMWLTDKWSFLSTQPGE